MFYKIQWQGPRRWFSGSLLHKCDDQSLYPQDPYKPILGSAGAQSVISDLQRGSLETPWASWLARLARTGWRVLGSVRDPALVNTVGGRQCQPLAFIYRHMCTHPLPTQRHKQMHINTMGIWAHLWNGNRSCVLPVASLTIVMSVGDPSPDRSNTQLTIFLYRFSSSSLVHALLSVISLLKALNLDSKTR